MPNGPFSTSLAKKRAQIWSSTCFGDGSWSMAGCGDS